MSVNSGIGLFQEPLNLGFWRLVSTINILENAIYQKMFDVGLQLKEEERQLKKDRSSSSSKVSLSCRPSCPALKKNLKKLCCSIGSAEKPGLDKNETLRLRGIISGVKTYNELLAELRRLSWIEKLELLELNRKYAELLKKSQNPKPK